MDDVDDLLESDEYRRRGVGFLISIVSSLLVFLNIEHDPKLPMSASGKICLHKAIARSVISNYFDIGVESLFLSPFITKDDRTSIL